jgi:hypothetical protein
MKRKTIWWHPAVTIGLVFAGAQAASAAGFEKLSKTGEEVLTACNPASSPFNTHCKVTSLPGVSGYSLIASRSAPLIINEVTVGTVYEKVWRNTAKPKVHIFGVKLTLNADQWDSSGASFNVNDVFRRARPGKAVSVAYYLDGATKALQASGRTLQGLNEFEEDEPERDNTWTDFRIDANAADPDGVSSASSPWLLTKTRAPTGVVLNSFGLRVLNSDFEDPFSAVELYTTSYEPDGVPPPEDDDDDEEED